MIHSNTVGKAPPNSSHFQSIAVVENVTVRKRTTLRDITNVNTLLGAMTGVTAHCMYSGNCHELRL